MTNEGTRFNFIVSEAQKGQTWTKAFIILPYISRKLTYEGLILKHLRFIFVNLDEKLHTSHD